MASRHLNPAALCPPPDGIYSHVVKVKDTVFISGQLARDPAGNPVSPGDVCAPRWRPRAAAPPTW